MSQTKVLKSIMGEELFESLNKALVKLGTKSVVDLEELHSAMKTAPKAVIAFLMKELKGMEKDQTKEVEIPWDESAKMTVTKLDSDVYKGLIVKDGKIVHEFDLTAIPQLAAHIMSAFEIYDEEEESEESEESEKSESMHEDIRQHLRALDDKINALMMLIASQSSMKKNEPWTKDFAKIAKANSEALGLIKPDVRKKFIDAVRGLKKAGLAPKMPTPPKAGSNVGGKQGLTQAGLHGDKTAHTDLSAKPKTNISANPMLNAPKPSVPQPKQPKTLTQSEKTMTVQKSELLHKCIDCGQPVSDCACFRALSRPEVKKTEGQNITLKFKGDWDQESIQALYKSIKRIRD